MSEAPRYKYPLQLPMSLKETAARLAREDGVYSVSESWSRKPPTGL